uniref:HTH_Tnp_Tc3_1 domain-containing protein n=1 Tax=Heterorhabditis bacteriophora TaxID=37862 RepID=A0A1I7WWM1_HETBA
MVWLYSLYFELFRFWNRTALVPLLANTSSISSTVCCSIKKHFLFHLKSRMENMPLVDQCRRRKVARGYLFNDIEKGKILTFSDAGLNRTEIARKIGRSTSVVANFLRAPCEYEIKKSGERPTKLGKREKRRITVMASNSTASLDEIRSIYCPIVSKTTVLEGTKGKSIHHAGKNKGMSDFNSKSQESQDGFCPYTHVMDFGMD